MKRKINYTGDQASFQPKLNFGQRKHDREKIAGLPPIGREDKDARRIIQECDTGKLGLDFEFDPKTKKAHITGVATKKEAAAARYNRDTLGLIAEKAERGVKLVGHSVLGADRPTMEIELGRKTPLSWWVDTMLKHYVVSQDFCKVEKGGKKEDSDDTGALGFMNLWSMAALYTRLWNWKICPGDTCEGVICPVHDPLGYCAVDSWAGLESDDEIDKRIEYWEIPEQFIEEMHELSELCLEMEERGVKVSRERIAELDKRIEEVKESLFLKNEDGEYEEFNPRSNQQALKWFAERGIVLKSTSKKDVQKKLEDAVDALGYDGEKLEDRVEQLIEDANVSDELTALGRLFKYKHSGKGVKAWFDDRYIKEGDLIHPRFIPCGTSTGRLASSKPNFQNIAARGWGSVIKSCVVPREPGWLLVDSDYCVDPDTKILTHDLRWVKAKHLEIGQGIFGFDEEIGKGFKHYFKKGKIVNKKNIVRNKYRITTSEGVTTVSSDHKFVVRRKKASGGDAVRQWVEAQNLEVGDMMAFTSSPWEEDKSYESGWLSGFFDGEGYVSCGSLGFGQKEGSLSEAEALKLCMEKGYNFNYGGSTKSKYFVQDSEGNPVKKQAKIAVNKYRISSIWESARFVGSLRPKRLLPKMIEAIDGLRTWGKLTKQAKVLKIEFLGTGLVVALETDIKTYISDGFLSHNCQLELRICLYESGIDPSVIGKDAFKWLVEKGGGLFEKAAENKAWSGRDLAKITSHAADYMEGLTLLSGTDLAKPSTKRLIDAGALRIYLKRYGAPFDWEYSGKVVAFTGANLAERLFGNREYGSRRQALAIQEDIYFKTFPSIRLWQKSVLDFIQENGYTRSKTGRILRLYGRPEDNAKVGVAFHGQGRGADYVQGQMLALKRLDGRIPLLQVHDSLVFEIPPQDDAAIRKWMDPMFSENWRMDGFWCPGKIKVGYNYGELREI